MQLKIKRLSDTERGTGGFGSTGRGALNGDGNESW